MFMTMVWILAFASSMLEMAFAFKVPLWARWAGRWPVLGLIVSITLSWFLGRIFGAHGLIALMGGIVSTIMTVPCYVVVEKWHSGDLKPKLARYRKDWDSAVQLTRDLWKVTYFMLRVITFPVWGYRGCKEWVTTQKARFART